MSAVHLHLLLSHVPILGIGFVLLLFAGAHLRRSNELALTALVLMLLVTLASLGVYFTGPAAQNVVGHLPGVDGAAVVRHNQWALRSTLAITAAGVVALITLFRFRALGDVPRRMMMLSFAVALVAFGMMSWTGWLGVQIRHPTLTLEGVVAPVGQGS